MAQAPSPVRASEARVIRPGLKPEIICFIPTAEAVGFHTGAEFVAGSLIARRFLAGDFFLAFLLRAGHGVQVGG